jgi:hypothetical protein
MCVLVQDILCHIHSLMPLQDVARAACVSRIFLDSWRCYPKLTFTNKTLGLKRNKRRRADIARDFIRPHSEKSFGYWFERTQACSP